jgi:hypothetical protein
MGHAELDIRPWFLVRELFVPDSNKTRRSLKMVLSDTSITSLAKDICISFE